MTLLRQYEWFDHFRANQSKLRDAAWLEQAIAPYAHIHMMGWMLTSPAYMKSIGYRGHKPRISQFPREFAEFLLLMAERKADSYLEIGASTGGSFFLADSYLRAVVPGYRGGMAVDWRNKIRDLEVYKKAFPETEFRHMDSQYLELGERRLGAVFVDARHYEECVIRDFDKVKDNTTLVGFHDIVLQGTRPVGGCTVGKAWAKIKDGRKSWEFVDTRAEKEARCGIGVVEI